MRVEVSDQGRTIAYCSSDLNIALAPQHSEDQTSVASVWCHQSEIGAMSLLFRAPVLPSKAILQSYSTLDDHYRTLCIHVFMTLGNLLSSKRGERRVLATLGEGGSPFCGPTEDEVIRPRIMPPRRRSSTSTWASQWVRPLLLSYKHQWSFILIIVYSRI